jgi:hypothetical protein
LESTIAHEYGHIIDNWAVNHDGTDDASKYNKEVNAWVREPVKYDPDGSGQKTGTAKRFAIDTLGSRSFYSQENESEFVAECICDVAMNGDKANATSHECVTRLKGVIK